jgi:magnesium-transporting ATPase (P-type)
MYYAIMDREMTNEKLLSSPKHYELGIKGLLFSTTKFWEWILEACLQGMLILIVSLFAVCYTTGRKHEGQIDPMSVASVMAFGMVVIFVNLKVFLFSYSHSVFSIIILLLSVFSYYFISAIITDWFPISAFFDNFDSHGATSMMFGNPNVFIAMIMLVYLGFFLQPIGKFFFSAFKKIRGRKVGPMKGEDSLFEEFERDKKEDLFRENRCKG